MRRSVITMTLVGGLAAIAAGQLAAVSQDTRDAETRGATQPKQSMLDALEAHAHAHPDDAVARLKLGFAYLELGDKATAQRWLDEAAAIDQALYENVMEGYGGESAGEIGQGGVAGGYPNSGPDIIVGDLHQLQRWGRMNNITAFSVGTISCNAGDLAVQWVAGTSSHPVIAQHMYRYKDGRFEMIGQSWVKHGFTALTGSLCQSQFGYGCQGPGGSILSPGCSDPYSSSLNGSYTYLGPKHEINATKGTFAYPFGNYPNSSPIGKRLQVHDNDLEPDLNQGAVYYVEGQYVAADDAAAGNALNNASYRRVNVSEGSAFFYNISFVPGHPTVRELPAIYAWQVHNPDVVIQEFDVPQDGRFIVAYRVEDNGDGTWSYEYAVHNLNSFRSAGRFSVAVAPGIELTDVDFHGVAWHSGAPYDNSPWEAQHENGMLTWATDPITENVNANALRWGTLYNFRFTADAPPVEGEAEIGMFRSGSVNEIIFTAAVPESPEPSTPGDLDGDGTVGVPDLLLLLGSWGECSDCGDCAADLDGGCNVGVSDLLILLANWG